MGATSAFLDNSELMLYKLFNFSLNLSPYMWIDKVALNDEEKKKVAEIVMRKIIVVCRTSV